MFFDLLKLKDFEYSEYDNPMAFGLYTNKDLSKTKLFNQTIWSKIYWRNQIPRKKQYEKN